MEKEAITIGQAQGLVFDAIKNVDFGDLVYECAQGIFLKMVDYVNTNYSIPEKEEILDSDQEWYDEIYDDFCCEVYEKMREFLNNQSK